ncbi:MAG: DUF2752 domain-containing protein [Ignavibacteriales bacterium]|nr:DUF2752 domain-containing protein [Ignavibacteriales bacterium]
MKTPLQNSYFRDTPVLILASYFAIGIVVQIIFGLDILPPCLFTTLFDISCPGCGITRASVHLVKFEFSSAWHTNPFIYLIAPFFLMEVFRFLRALISRFN